MKLIRRDHAAQPAVDPAVHRHARVLGELFYPADDAEDGSFVLVAQQLFEDLGGRFSQHGVVQAVHGARVEAEGHHLTLVKIASLGFLHKLLERHQMAPVVAGPAGSPRDFAPAARGARRGGAPAWQGRKQCFRWSKRVEALVKSVLVKRSCAGQICAGLVKRSCHSCARR